MKLTVLGSSSKGNGYLLTSFKGETLVLEAGVPLKEVKKALKFDISGIVGVLVSHAHKDHSGYIEEYIHVGIEVNGNVDVLRDSIFSKCIDAGGRFSIGDFKVIVFECNHDAPCLGFLINHPESGTILFATDTKGISNTFRGLNHILIECNYEPGILLDNIWNDRVDNARAKRTSESHMSLPECLYELKRNDLSTVQNIVLLHLSEQNSDADMFLGKVIEATGKRVEIAKPGIVVELNKLPY